MDDLNLEKVRKTLMTCNKGCTITELANKAEISRNTARAHIERLIGQGCVEVKNKGPAKILKYICDEKGNVCKPK